MFGLSGGGAKLWEGLGGGGGDQFISPRYACISKISLLLGIEAFQDFDSPPGGIGLSFVLGAC